MVHLGKRFEFHTHTFFSDGVLSPAELIRHAVVNDNAVIALTDHVDFSNIEHVIKCQQKMIREVSWDIRVLQGVELTHIPKDKISKLARMAKDLGAEIVVVHGETVVEPVEAGTNNAVVTCSDVDILAHPGKISVDDAELARENGIFLELSARHGHNKTNGHVADIARRVKANLLVNSDAHAPEDLASQQHAFEIAVAASLSQKEAFDVVETSPLEFLKRLE